MPASTENDSVVANRRHQLRRWIDDLFEGVKVDFIASTNDGERQINQGELSGLLRAKSFGEKRARTLEAQAKMPPFYLDSTLSPGEAKSMVSRGGSAPKAMEPLPRTSPAPSPIRRPYWPFKLASPERIQDLQRRLGARKGAAALHDIDKHLDLVLSRWEGEVVPRKSTKS